MGKIINVNKEEFDKIIESEKGVILVDFWAQWCGPCKMLSPELDKVSAENEDIIILKVNVDENPELSTEYGVRSIPVVFAIRDGERLDKFIGAKSKEDIISFIDALPAEETEDAEDELKD